MRFSETQQIIKPLWRLLALLVVCGSGIPAAVAQSQSDQKSTTTGSDLTPDLREEDTKLKLQKGNLVVVPIPISNPTLGTGLVAGGAYFYPQTEEEKKSQPASLTAAAGFYTSNDSLAYALVQQNYWKKDTWRITAVVGHADLKLKLLTLDPGGSEQNLNWLIDGNFALVKALRSFHGDWYAGGVGRWIDMSQFIDGTLDASAVETASDARSVGIGANIEYDSRDMPINSYSGGYFKTELLFNDTRLGSDKTYQSYKLSYSSYHQVSEPVVLAWEVEGCKKGGSVPLWDACTVKLRGFPVTDYLGGATASAQLEARWHMTKRWGMVGFAGAGYVGSSINNIREGEPIPSYGLGVRFMVLPAKRINIRVDYAWSIDSDAIYVSVGEAF